MKIGLIDLDSKIPNLALMKLSEWHKRRGNVVELTSPLFANLFDEIFVSKIFNWTETPVLPDRAVIGGCGEIGADPLPPEIETIMPDYSLYNCEYAIGYTSRGCNRKCPFCVVPKIEGKFRPVADIAQFWRGQKRMMLLDNSANTDSAHFLKIMNQIIEHQIEFNFIQGLDIRLLTEEQTMMLKCARRWKRLHFAWDNMRDENAVRRGIELLTKYKLNNDSMFYVLIGFNTTIDQDVHRVETLRELKTNPFVMPYDKHDPRQMEFARWVNRKEIFSVTTWDQYSTSIRGVGERYA